MVDGELDEQRIIDALTQDESKARDEVEKMLNICKAIDSSENECERAFKIYECYTKNR